MNPRQKAAERTKEQEASTPKPKTYTPPMKPAPEGISGAEYATLDVPGYPGTGTQGGPGVIPIQAGSKALDLSQPANPETLSNMSQEDYDKYTKIHGGTGSGRSFDWGEFARGAVNNALFGAPEAIAVHGANKIPILNQIPGLQKSQEDVDKAQYEWDLRHYHPDFKTGDEAGGILSTFIPIGGWIEKGAQGAKAAVGGAKAVSGGVKAAEKLAEAGKQSRLQQLLNKPIEAAKAAMKAENEAGQTLGGAVRTNAINSAAGQALRDTFTNGAPDAGNVLTAGAWGAGGGAIGHKIAGMLAPFGKTGAREGAILNKYNPDLPEKAQQAAMGKLHAYSGGTGIQPIEDSMGRFNYSPVDKALHFKNYSANVAITGSRYGIKPGDMDSLAAAQAANGAKLDELSDAVVKSGGMAKIQERFNSPEFADQNIGSIVKNAESLDPKVMDYVGTNTAKMINDISSAQTPNQIKGIIDGNIQNLTKQQAPGNIANSYALDVAKMMREDFNNMMKESAKNAGRPDLADAYMENGNIKDIATLMQNAQFSKANTESGVPGAIGTAVTGSLSGHGTVRSAARGIDRLFGNKISESIRNKGADKFDQMLSKAPGSTDEAAASTVSPIKQKAADIINERGGAMLAQNRMEGTAQENAENNPNNVGRQGKMIAGPMIDNPDVAKSVDNALRSNFTRSTLEGGLAFDPEEQEEAYQVFKNAYMEEITDANGDINPDKFANAIFTNETDRETFPKAYNIYKSIFPQVENAMKAPKGIPGVADTPVINEVLKGPNIAAANYENANMNANEVTKSSRDAVIGGFKMIGQAMGKNPDESANDAAQILASSKDAAEANQRLMNYFRLNDPTSYKVLQKAGIVK